MPERNCYYTSVYGYCDECDEETETEIEIIDLIAEHFGATMIRNLINDLIRFHHKNFTCEPNNFIESIYYTLNQLKENKKINIRFL